MININKWANKLMVYDFNYRGYNLLKSRVYLQKLNRIYFNLNNNMFYSTNTGEQITSLQDIVNYKTGKFTSNPYQGLLKGKENLAFRFGNAKLYPSQSEYDKFEDICDWKFRIRKIIKEDLIPGVTYDIAVLGQDILNEEYITYGKHFLINNESDINAIITRIEGNIFVNSLSINSGEIEVAKNKDELEIGMRLVIFLIRSVSFINKVSKLVNKVLVSNTAKKRNNEINNKELLKLKNSRIKALINSLPNSNLLIDFGSLIDKSYIDKSGNTGSLYKYRNNKILIRQIDDKKIEGIVYNNEHEYFRFTDINVSSRENKNNEFLRTIFNTTIKYVNKKIIYIDTIIKSKKVDDLKMELVRDTKYGTFDIETALDNNNKFIPVSCGWKINELYKDYIISNYESVESMFKNCFDDMFEHSNYTWYAHNLGGFDSVFILKTLFDNYSKTKVNFKDGKPLSIKIRKISKDPKTNKNITKYIIYKDSYKLLPLSIRNLIKANDIKTQKLYFPYLFMKTDNLNYEGKLPDKSFFDNISDLDYKKIADEFKDKKWNLKDELLKYMKNDIVALYQIVDRFSQDMFELENLNITSVSTISSLALNTFLTNYYDKKKNPIHIPRHANYLNIKNAYFGGRVEVFSSYAENIYIYDVVSLYPYCMLMDLPIGNLIKSTDKNLDNYFGFCYASVNVPDGIRAPILPFRKDDGGLIYPTGNWTGWFSSEILKKGRDFQNIKIDVHYGYKLYKSKDLFSKFVQTYSNLKINAEREGNKAKRTTIKFILNSLYGRMGLKYEPHISDFVKSSVADMISLIHEVFDRLYIGNEIEFIKYTKAPSDLLKELDRNEYNKLKNKTNLDAQYVVRAITISAMISSYGSIVMNPFLNMPNNPTYYTDTDSLFTKYPLDNKYIGSELGKFSFKGIAKRAYFISPKTYCLIMEDDTVIIKCKGLDNNLLNENHFKELLQGNDVTIDSSKIFTDIKRGSGALKSMKLTIKPEINNRKVIKQNGLNYDTVPYHLINGKIQ